MAAEDSSQPPPGSPRHLLPSAAAIRGQLGKILTSPTLVNSPSLQNFLRFIVEKTLSGEATTLKGYTVATQVLGRKADFDPSLDPIVRIQAGRLRRALEKYYQEEGKKDAVIIDMPRGGYVPVFQAASGGAARAPLAGGTQPVASPLSLGPSVAVMPLLNLTGDRSQEYFTEGLAEELTSELARYQDLRVIAYQSTRKWKDHIIDARDAGRDLGVRFLVEGSIRKDTRTVKIDLHVVDTQKNLVIWGEQYNRELKADSLIALQEEIARKVSAKVGSELGIIPRTLSRESRRKPPEALETYEAFLRFYHHVTIMSPETGAGALIALEQAVRREPDSALAWSLLSFLYGQSYALHLMPLESPLEKARLAAQKGARLEPENQMARAAMAQVHFFRNEREQFLAEAATALALNPNAPALIGFLGWLLALYGEWEEGLATLEKGIDLNPHYPGWFHMAPYFFLFLQENCEEAYQEALAFKMPQLFWDPLLRAASLGRLARREEGARALAELLALKPNFPSEGPFLISCFVKFPYLGEGLLEGLRLAGLKS
jgi:adenylate cyclase